MNVMLLSIHCTLDVSTCPFQSLAVRFRPLCYFINACEYSIHNSRRIFVEGQKYVALTTEAKPPSSSALNGRMRWCSTALRALELLLGWFDGANEQCECNACQYLRHTYDYYRCLPLCATHTNNCSDYIDW
jgi:hypothetical protein